MSLQLGLETEISHTRGVIDDTMTSFPGPLAIPCFKCNFILKRPRTSQTTLKDLDTSIRLVNVSYTEQGVPFARGPGLC